MEGSDILLALTYIYPPSSLLGSWKEGLEGVEGKWKSSREAGLEASSISQSRALCAAAEWGPEDQVHEEIIFGKETNKASSMNEKEKAIQPFWPLSWETGQVVKIPTSFLQLETSVEAHICNPSFVRMDDHQF